MKPHFPPSGDAMPVLERVQPKTNYEAVDLAKLLCAFLVLGVHTRPFYELHSSLGFFFENILARLAVPFFFISSSYFFVSKLLKLAHAEDARLHLYGFLKRILTLYLLWTVIYLPYNLYNDYKTSASVGMTLWAYSKKFFLVGSHFQLWYLLALMYSMSIVYYFVRRGYWTALALLSGVLLVVGLLGDSYLGLVPRNTVIYDLYRGFIAECKSTRVGIFFGVPFIAAGAFLARYKTWLTSKRAGILTVVFGVCYLAETQLVRHFQLADDHNLYVFLLPLSLCLFILLMRIQLPALQAFTTEMRHLSVGIYCAHPLFMMVCYRIFAKLHLNVDQHATLYFVFIAVCTFFFTLLLLKSRVRLLQKLVS